MSDPYFTGGGAATADPFFSGGSSSNDPYFGGSGGKKKKAGSFGLNDLGIFGNLIEDAKDTIVGIPAGAVTLATHPGRAAKGIARSYADMYGPLIHGDIAGFAHNVYNNPLGPILDALTIATLGAGSVAKAGSALSKAGAISDTSRLATLGRAGELTLRGPSALADELGALKVTKTTSRNPVIRGRQTLVDRALKQLDYEFPVLGEQARFGRAVRRGPAAKAAVLKQLSGPYVNAFAKLSRPERRALGMVARIPLTEHLDAWKTMLERQAKSGNDEAGRLLKDISDAKVTKLYHAPSKDMLAAHAEADKLAVKAADLLVETGVLTRSQAEAARYRHTLIASGRSEVQPSGKLRTPSAALKRAQKRVNRLEKRYDKLSEKGKGGGYDIAGPDGLPVFKSGQPSIERVGAALSVAKDELQGLQKRFGAATHPDMADTNAIAELRAQIEQAGRPQPLYLPDVPAKPRTKGAAPSFTTAGRNPVHQSDGLLFVTGKLALDPDVLGPAFLRDVQFVHYRDLHDLLLDASVRVRGNVLPEGHVWVKTPVGSHGSVGNIDALNEALSARGLTGVSVNDALFDHGSRYAVPVKLARQFEAEFQRSNKAVRWFIEKPTTVWRALVLNLRVAWLVNNVIGNHLMYALRYAGPRGLAAYLRVIGSSKAAHLLRLPESKNVIHEADLAEFLPGQHSGTLVGTQAPTIKGGRALRRAGLGLASADKAIEGGLRRAAVTTELRHHPAVKARLKAMPAETRSFRQAARESLADPKIAKEIDERVNSALGDFLGLSPGEKKYLRAVFPFYAWYRAITQITFKLPLDYPGRTALIAKLSEVGLQSSASLGPLPSYLEGSIPLGNDRLLKTQGLNPYATVPQLGRAAAVPFFPGARTNALAGTMNPFVQALGGLVFGKETTKRGLLSDFAAGITTDLPQATLIHDAAAGPAGSKLYQPSGTDDLLAYLGAGVKTINRKRAAELAAQGR